MKQPILLIHGTWGAAGSWDYIIDDLTNLQLDPLAPSLRYHDLPFTKAEAKVGPLSITAYVDDLVEIVEQCDRPPILLGHSLGCLLAQLVAERISVKGLILLGPAPTANIFQLYPTMIRSFARHFLQWGFWYKAMPPYKHALFNYAMQEQSQVLKEEIFEVSVPESRLVYTQMAFPEFDPKQSTKVDFSKIKAPLLIVTGSRDKMTVPKIAMDTAKNYPKGQATLVKITGADHYYIAGKYKDQVVYQIKRWLNKQSFI